MRIISNRGRILGAKLEYILKYPNKYPKIIFTSKITKNPFGIELSKTVPKFFLSEIYNVKFITLCIMYENKKMYFCP